jgi:hypothetical protein
MGIPAASPEDFFLCFGLPKSGTTFLQRLLNLHPEVSCPAEHQFRALSGHLDKLLETYGNTLKVVDRRTGGQGATLPDRATSLEILRAVILILSRSAARGKQIHGLNDNAIFSSMDFADRLLDHPKMIAIIRNPVDLAISAWRHSLRLARDEPQNAAAHLALLDNPAGTLEGYVLEKFDWYNLALTHFLDYAQGRPNFLVVLYEKLVSNKKAELRRLFGFLGADTSDAIIDRIALASSPAEMARNSTNPEFFGVDTTAKEALRVSHAVREQALEKHAPILERAGYQLSDLMAGH